MNRTPILFNDLRNACGPDGPCSWMADAVECPPVDAPKVAAYVFRRITMPHPDTMEDVVRFVVEGGGLPRPRILRACPVCGGNPNETRVMRTATREEIARGR